MIHIYYSHINEVGHNGLLNEYLYDFPIEIQKSILNYRRWQDAQLTILGRLLLKFGLDTHFQSQDFTWDNILTTKFGKPHFKNDNLYFNISHSGEIAICAICDIDAIGIDIEIMNPIEIEDFRTQMTGGEWVKVNNAINSKTEFYKYWTQKEAVIKADGKGLSNSLKSFEIKDNASTINNDFFALKALEINQDYACYLALKVNNINEPNKLLSDENLNVKHIKFSSDRSVQFI